MLQVPVAWAQGKGPRTDVVLSSRVRLARNLRSRIFPGRSGEQNLREVLAEAFAAARKAPGFADAALLELGDLDGTDLRFLVERHLISPLLAQAPKHRGVAVGPGEAMSLMVNEEDHLRLASLKPGFSLDAAWDAADAADAGLSTALPYAFQREFGYLSACPTNLGTGMRVSCLAHLAALSLSGAIDKLLHDLGQAGLAVRGLYGEGTKVLGELFQISNGTCLGRTEAEYLAGVGDAASRIIDLETAARERLADTSRVQFDDRIYRSVGALQQARLMSFEEAAHHLSLLRLGHAMGFKVPGSLALATELLLASQPAHMALRARRELSAAERDAARANLLREKLG